MSEIDWKGVALAINQIGQLNAPTKIDEMAAAARLRKTEKDEMKAYRESEKLEARKHQDKLTQESRKFQVDYRNEAWERQNAISEDKDTKMRVNRELNLLRDKADKEYKLEHTVFLSDIKEKKKKYDKNREELALSDLALSTVGFDLGRLNNKYNTKGGDELYDILDKTNNDSLREGIQTFSNELAQQLDAKFEKDKVRANVTEGKNLYDIGAYVYTDPDKNRQVFNYDENQDGTISTEERLAAISEVVRIQRDVLGEDVRGIEEGFLDQHDTEQAITNKINREKKNAGLTLSEEAENSAIKARLTAEHKGDFSDADDIDFILDMKKKYGQDTTSAEWTSLHTTQVSDYNKAFSRLLESDKLHYIETRDGYESEVDLAEGEDEGMSDFSGYKEAKTGHGITQDFYDSINKTEIYKTGDDKQDFELSMALKHAFHTVDSLAEDYDNGTLGRAQIKEFEEAKKRIVAGRKVWGK